MIFVDALETIAQNIYIFYNYATGDQLNCTSVGFERSRPVKSSRKNVEMTSMRWVVRITCAWASLHSAHRRYTLPIQFQCTWSHISIRGTGLRVFGDVFSDYSTPSLEFTERVDLYSLHSLAVYLQKESWNEQKKWSNEASSRGCLLNGLTLLRSSSLPGKEVTCKKWHHIERWQFSWVYRPARIGYSLMDRWLPWRLNK